MNAKPVHLWVRVGASSGFESVARLARTAERGLFDGIVVGGRPAPGPTRFDTVTLLSAVAAVTDRLGLAATVDANAARAGAPARRLATLDHLSAGRAAWSVLGCSAAEIAGMLAACRALWDTWAADALIADAERGVFVREGGSGGMAGCLDGPGRHPVPRSPQGHPVLLHAAGSERDRELGAREADVIVIPVSTLPAGQARYREVHDRLRHHGRPGRDVLVLAEATPVDTSGSVAERLDEYVQAGACDGFVLAGQHGGRGDLDEFVDTVVPELQARGAYRSGYPGATLRDQLGLPYPPAGAGRGPGRAPS